MYQLVSNLWGGEGQILIHNLLTHIKIFSHLT
jgi:hypothetical protein